MQGLANAGAPVAGIVAQPPPGFGTHALSLQALKQFLATLTTTVPLARGLRPQGAWKPTQCWGEGMGGVGGVVVVVWTSGGWAAPTMAASPIAPLLQLNRQVRMYLA
jgi:hypothetical protein